MPKWTVYKYADYPSTARYTLPTPANSEVDFSKTSSATVIKLVDGSNAFVSPQIKSVVNPDLSWEISEATTPADLLAYEACIITDIDNMEKVVVVDHTASSFSGYFKNVKKIFTQSGHTQRYKLVIDFLRKE